MKSKALLIAVLLAASNFAWANGGISVNNDEQQPSYTGQYFNGPSVNGTSASVKLNNGPSYTGQYFNGPSVKGLSSSGRLNTGTYNGKYFTGAS